MKIFIYWNGIDTNSKKIYKFLSDTDFVCRLRQSNDVRFYRMHQDFQLENDILQSLESSDMAIFFTHGTEDAILKRSFLEDQLKNRYTLIDINNSELLKNKKVIAICCYSAKLLGKYCTEDNHICETYVGFNDAIEYGINSNSNREFRSLTYSAYSGAFLDAFDYALQFKCTANEFITKLKFNLYKMMTSEIFNSRDRTLISVSQPSFHIRAANALVARGNINTVLFT